jgi:hypothetical protein
MYLCSDMGKFKNYQGIRLITHNMLAIISSIDNRRDELQQKQKQQHQKV